MAKPKKFKPVPTPAPKERPIKGPVPKKPKKNGLKKVYGF